jgi:hypothetical protein
MTAIIPKIKAEVINGSLKFDSLNKERLDKHLLNLIGKIVEIIIKPFRHKRTVPQNSYYWFCLSMISEPTGYTTDELHEFFKRIYLKKIITIGGKEYEVSQSTKNLDTDRFTKYIDKIKAFALAKLELYIPSPDEAYLNDFIVDEDIEEIKPEDLPNIFF